MVGSRIGTYLIKAVDKNGNYSVNESLVTTDISAIGNFNAVATQEEAPSFSGTKYQVYKDDNNAIRLDSGELFDSGSGLFDSPLTLFDAGVEKYDLYSEGYYDFVAPLDIGGNYTVRITASLTQTADNLDELFDDGRGALLFDDAPSNFDGDTPTNCSAHLEIATSADNITYTAFRNFIIGDYTGRYFKFRLFLKSFDLASTPVVSAVSVNIDVEDKIQSGNDLISGTGTYTVTFTSPFYSDNYAVGISAQALATGDYYTLGSKTINGFNIAFKNSSGTGISKTFDYLAKGY